MKIAIVLNIIPSYRQGFYDLLLSKDEFEITIFAQDRIPGLNLNLIHSRYTKNVRLVKYVCAKREKIGWQFLPFKELLSQFDLVFVDGNPRQLSHFILASLLNLLNKKIVLWTMAHSFRGFSPTENLRLLWSRMFKNIFVYTDDEVKFLHSKGFNSQFIVGMNNGLNQRFIDSIISNWNEKKLEEWRYQRRLEGRRIILSCARLDPKNKFEYMIYALKKIVIDNPSILWCVIGAGVEKDKLTRLAQEYEISDNVIFVGEIYKEEDLAPWFLSSEIFVHPAAIGLSLLHAFGYGLPVITNGNKELHNPEYAAFKHKVTGLNYKENDIDSLNTTINELLTNTNERILMGKNAQKIAREEYNSHVMLNRFIEIANHTIQSQNNENKTSI